MQSVPSHEPDDPIKVHLNDADWSKLVITLVENTDFQTAKAVLVKILSQPTQGGVTMPAQEWNSVLSTLQQGRYTVVAPLISKIVVQANAAQPPQVTQNGIDAGEFKDAAESGSIDPKKLRPGLRRPANA